MSHILLNVALTRFIVALFLFYVKRMLMESFRFKKCLTKI